MDRLSKAVLGLVTGLALAGAPEAPGKGEAPAIGVRGAAVDFDLTQQGGSATVSMEQVLAWDPEVIVTIDQTFAQSVRSNPLWRSVSAVKTGRVHLSPKLPFGWIDFPPSVNL